MRETIYTKFSNERNIKYNIRTDIVENENGKRYVSKIASSFESVEHIEGLKLAETKLNCLFEKTPFCANHIERDVSENQKGTVDFEFVEGETLENQLDRCIQENNRDAFFSLVEKYANAVTMAFARETNSSGKINSDIFGTVELTDGLLGTNFVDMDLIFPNIVVTRDKWYVIDYEWTFQEWLPAKYVIYRAIFYYQYENETRKSFLGEDIVGRLGITEEEARCFEQLETNFQNNVYYNVNSVIKRNSSLTKLEYLPNMATGEIEKNNISDGLDVCIFQSGKWTVLSDSYELKKSGKEYFFNISIEDSIDTVRICVSRTNCVISIRNVKYEGGRNIGFTTNGKKLSRSVYLFEKTQPYIEINNRVKNATNIVVEVSIFQADSEIMYMLNECIEDRKRLVEQKQVLNDKNNQLERLNSDLNIVCADRVNQLEMVQYSLSWKLTKPVRFLGHIAKKLYKNVKQGNKTRVLYHEDTPIGETNVIETENEKHVWHLNDISTETISSKQVAVQLHLYYEDLLPEFLGYLEKIPCEFDVFVSCRENANVKRIYKSLKKLSRVNKVVIKCLPNRGRDVAPVFVWFAKELMEYDYFLHVHSKKSLYAGEEKVDWRQYSLNSLLGSEAIVKKIFALLDGEDKVGLVYPDHYDGMPMGAYFWLANEMRGRQLLEGLEIEFEPGVIMYPVGSFYWAKVDALKPLFDLQLQIEDFEEEVRQNDGTLAHAIERVLGFVSQKQGYQNAIIDYREGVVRRNISTKAFRQYLELESNGVLDHLMQYDVISFDIFDTLICRGVMNPCDLFRIMSEKIKTQYGVDVDFAALRKKSEEIAMKEKGNYTNIDDIYDCLPRVSSFDAKTALSLKEMELELEQNLSIAREDMRSIYHELLDAGKTVICTSDMYLKKNQILNLLTNCGYECPDELWVSCECGMRKDSGNIWDAIIAGYADKSFIHVGDNARSDWQTLIDKGYNAFLILSSRDECKISAYRNILAKSVSEEVEASLAVGMSVNGGIFNSPFALGKNLNAEFGSAYSLGFGVFGSLFALFLEWLEASVPKENQLLFLAREGYLLEPLYQLLIEKSGRRGHKHQYFLTSRRAASVAAIKTEEDIRRIVGMNYKGKLSNLLVSRFGLTLPEFCDDVEIWIDENHQTDIDMVMDIINDLKDELLSRVSAENEAYLSYISQVAEDVENNTLIDVGYSGTIQFFLSKLLECHISGAYLATFGNPKPLEIGCAVDSMSAGNEMLRNAIFQTQLFLEAVLQAPVGQLICFDKYTKKPVFKDARGLSLEIRELQQGIRDYIIMYANAIRDTNLNLNNQNELVSEMYSQFLQGKCLSDEVASIFAVEDDYCQNKFLKYLKEYDGWG